MGHNYKKLHKLFWIITKWIDDIRYLMFCATVILICSVYYLATIINHLTKYFSRKSSIESNTTLQSLLKLRTGLELLDMNVIHLPLLHMPRDDNVDILKNYTSTLTSPNVACCVLVQGRWTNQKPTAIEWVSKLFFTLIKILKQDTSSNQWTSKECLLIFFWCIHVW